jgi:hypothetical protein
VPVLTEKMNFMPSTYCWVSEPVQLVFLLATMLWPGVQLSITYGPVPSGLRLICLPTLSTHSLGSTEVNGMLISMRKAPSGFSSVIWTV